MGYSPILTMNTTLQLLNCRLIVPAFCYFKLELKRIKIELTNEKVRFLGLLFFLIKTYQETEKKE